MNSWEFETAEQAFGDVVDAAIRSGPQRIESHGMPVAVVLSYDEYRRLMGRKEGQAGVSALHEGRTSLSALVLAD